MDLNSKIYVAGHTGLVGSAICKNLRLKNYKNLILKTHDELDLINQRETGSFFAIENPEYVFLAAAKVGGIMANKTYRADFIYDNLQIQNNIISNSYKYGVKKLLFLGSTCIYPKDAGQPLKEDSLLTSPLEYTNEPYAIAKIAGIKMCESFNLQYDTNFISVMPTNLYGPNDNFDLEKSHVLPALLRKIYLGTLLERDRMDDIKNDLDKRPIEGINGNNSSLEIKAKLSKYGINKTGRQVLVEIWGSGKPLREFLWSEDMADACVYIMENINFSDLVSDNNYIRNTHINIGTGKEISINDLAVLVKKITGFEGRLIFNDSKPDGTMRKITDTSKLNHLGWKHKIDLEEGIVKLYSWYLNN